MDDKLPIAELHNLTTGYIKDIDVLENVSMTVPRCRITSIIGSNGAGKSTVLKALFGYLDARKGSIHFNGNNVTGWRPQQAIRNGIAYVAQGRCNFPNMSVRENIEVGGFTRKDSQLYDDIEAIMDNFPILRDKESEMAGNLSGGQQQILEMAMGLINRPQLLLIDEPTLGLSPKLFNEVFHHIIRIKEEGISVLMVEQNAAQALEISDYAIVLRLGKNWMDGPALEILHNSTVRQHYLGGEPDSG